MGQGEVIDLLRRRVKPIPTIKIAELLGKNTSTVTNLLRKLIKEKVVDFILLPAYTRNHGLRIKRCYFLTENKHRIKFKELGYKE